MLQRRVLRRFFNLSSDGSFLISILTANPSAIALITSINSAAKFVMFGVAYA
jgi:hypothetical protein